MRSSYYMSCSKPMLTTTPVYYWISWKDSLIAFGFGQDIGKGTLMICNEPKAVDMINATVTVNGTIYVPFRYYVGPKGQQ